MIKKQGKSANRETVGQIGAAYDIRLSYDENFEKGPFFTGTMPDLYNGLDTDGPENYFRLLDFRLNSLIGIPAGLLLNSNWVKLYSRLGFDILTYKTVRSVCKTSHNLPNCLFLKQMDFSNGTAVSQEFCDDPLKATITNSFGMPSRSPEQWQPDVERSKSFLRQGQLLVVSVVGCGDSPAALVEDFKMVSMMAEDAGADIVELNLSCPNVKSGSALYQEPSISSMVTAGVRQALNGTPVFVKTGHYEDSDLLSEFLRLNVNFIDGVVGINSLKMKVVDSNGQSALGVDRIESGVCGYGIRHAGNAFVKKLLEESKKMKYDLAVMATGGVVTPEGFDEYLNMGAAAALSCTGAMFNPMLAAEWLARRPD